MRCRQPGETPHGGKARATTPLDDDKARTETSENMDEQAVLALVVAKQVQILKGRGAPLSRI
jgi:hypothetical protein